MYSRTGMFCHRRADVWWVPGTVTHVNKLLVVDSVRGSDRSSCNRVQRKCKELASVDRVFPHPAITPAGLDD